MALALACFTRAIDAIATPNEHVVLEIAGEAETGLIVLHLF
jgi:hypothetical protein